MSLPISNRQYQAPSTHRSRKIEAVARFGLQLFKPENGKSYQVMSDDVVWFYTNHTDYESAVSDTIRELQLRCYLPTPGKNINVNTTINQNTDKQFQQHITQYNQQSANQIRLALDLLNQLALMMTKTVPHPEKMAFNPFLKTYLMTWNIDGRAEFSVRIHQNSKVSLEYQNTVGTIRDSYENEFDVIRLKALAGLLPGKFTAGSYPNASPMAPEKKERPPTIEEVNQRIIDELSAELHGM